LDPDHAPEAVQLEAFVEDQEIVTAELTEAEEDEEEMVTVGVGVGAGVPPPPPHPAERTKPSSKKHHLSSRRLICNILCTTASPQPPSKKR
jgi:hypothetical protein